MGNRKSELTVEGSYTYQEKGITKTVSSTRNSMTYTYDQLTGNRLVSATGQYDKTVGSLPTDSLSISKTVSYSYDVLGNQNGQTTRSTSPSWETPQVDTESTAYNELWRVATQGESSYYYDGNGIQLRENTQYYFYDTNGITRVMEDSGKSHSYTRFGGQLLASNDGFYYIVNARGDAVCLISDGTFKTGDGTSVTAGNVLAYYVYEPFGATRATQKDPVLYNKFKFAGGLQSSTGNYMFGARVYAPGDGRWISMDPYRGSMGDPLSLNRYAYCSNDPLNYIDPSGFRQVRIYTVKYRHTVTRSEVFWHRLLEASSSMISFIASLMGAGKAGDVASAGIGTFGPFLSSGGPTYDNPGVRDVLTATGTVDLDPDTQNVTVTVTCSVKGANGNTLTFAPTIRTISYDAETGVWTDPVTGTVFETIEEILNWVDFSFSLGYGDDGSNEAYQ